MYKKIMVPLDGSKLAECVLPHVESIARGCGVGEVVFIRAVEPFHLGATGPGFAFSEKEMKQFDVENRTDAKAYLDKVVSQLQLDKTRVQTQVVAGKIAESLAEYASKNGVDLIVIATHGFSGISRWVWGSVADRILHSACVPVLMVRAPGCIPGF